MIQMIRRIFLALIWSGGLRQQVFPWSADGAAANAVTLTKNAAAWTWGAWAQMATIVQQPAEVQIVGFTLENFTGAVAQGEVGIGSGVGAAGIELGRFPVVAASYILPKPIHVPAGTGLVARYRKDTAVADTVDIKLITLQGF
jgi:hypothetical protein